jgi:hypothetical protein
VDEYGQLRVQDFYTRRRSGSTLAYDNYLTSAVLLSISVPVHQLPGLALLPVAAKWPPSEGEHARGVYPQPYAPAQEWPVESPPPAREHIDHEQPDVDQDVGGGVRIETLQLLHAGVRSIVALVLTIHFCLLSYPQAHFCLRAARSVTAQISASAGGYHPRTQQQEAARRMPKGESSASSTRKERSSVDIQEMVSRSQDTATVARVYGEPQEKDGTTLIPAAKVSARGGSGPPEEGSTREEVLGPTLSPWVPS